MVSHSILIAAAIVSLLDPRPPAPCTAQDPNQLRRIARDEGRVNVIVGFHTRQGFAIEGGHEGIAAIQDHFLALMGRSFEDARVTRFTHLPYLALDLDERGLERVLDIDLAARLRRDHDVTLGVGLDLDWSPLTCAAPSALPGSATGAVPMNEVLETIEVAPLHTLGYRGEGQVIVVVDTGVRPDYYFLEGAVLWGSHPSAGIVDCDYSEPIKADPKDGGPLDGPNPSTHGTLVASVAGGDAKGTPGVAPGAQIISIQVESEEGKILTSTVAAALEEVLCKWSKVAQIAAVNISLGEGNHAAACDGGTTEAILLMLDAVERLKDIAIPIVVGAGNWAPSEEIAFPACLSSTVSICSTLSDGKSKYINSKWTALADMAAPTGYISIPGESPWTEVWIPQGTSTSAPFVSGAIALLRQAYPKCPPSEIVKALAENGFEVTSGGVTLQCIRVMSAFEALNETHGPPAPPPSESEEDPEVASDEDLDELIGVSEDEDG